MEDIKSKLNQRLGIDCDVIQIGDRLLIRYIDGCATSQVKAIADELGLDADIDRGFSEEKFTDFAVDFSLDLEIPIVDVRFKKQGDRYKVIIPDSDIGVKLLSVI